MSLSGLNCHHSFGTDSKKFELFQISYADIPTKSNCSDGDTVPLSMEQILDCFCKGVYL